MASNGWLYAPTTPPSFIEAEEALWHQSCDRNHYPNLAAVLR